MRCEIWLDWMSPSSSRTTTVGRVRMTREVSAESAQARAGATCTESKTALRAVESGTMIIESERTSAASSKDPQDRAHSARWERSPTSEAQIMHDLGTALKEHLTLFAKLRTM